MEQLTDEETEILDFERHWWKYVGAKEAAIRETFDWSSTRYYQALHALIARPAALAHDPLTVKRLQRLKAARTAEVRSSPGVRRLSGSEPSRAPFSDRWV